jgi:serine/threonine protein phosphatase 1
VLKDRLFSVGDLVDRGAESDEVLQFLDQPWFFAVQGNHEQMAAMYVARQLDAGTYGMNGGHWLIDTPQEERWQYANAFVQLPLVIELETEDGLVGLVHAACDYSSGANSSANWRPTPTVSASRWEPSRSGRWRTPSGGATASTG